MKLRLFAVLATLTLLCLSTLSIGAPPDRCSPWPECKNGDGEPPPGGIANNDTIASWSLDNSKLVYEAFSRSCSLESAQNDGAGGHYTCNLDGNHPDWVSFELGQGQEIDKKGNAVGNLMSSDPLCSEMGADMFPFSMTPTHYPYDWDGNCTSPDECSVRIRNWFAGNNHPNPRVGLIVVDGFTTVSVPSNANVNPFALSQVMQIHEVVVTFKGNGTNKNEATCRWSADDGNLSVGEVEFESAPN